MLTNQLHALRFKGKSTKKASVIDVSGTVRKGTVLLAH